MFILLSLFCCFVSPWYNRYSWQGAKKKTVIYLSVIVSLLVFPNTVYIYILKPFIRGPEIHTMHSQRNPPRPTYVPNCSK